MHTTLLAKIKDSLISVVPITLIIVILNFTLPNRMPAGEFVKFIIGAALLIIGMVLYNLGSETALEPIGEVIGNRVTSSKKIPLILLVGFIIGFIVTIAEPDLMVLGEQLGSIKWTLILTIAVGVGLFLVLALIRILGKFNLNILLIVLYAALFVLAFFAEDKFLPLAFDSGGVTTGPVTVPFILAIGVGVASVMGGKNRKEDSFGIVALCSIGPIISVVVLSLIFKPQINSSLDTNTVGTVQGAFRIFAAHLPEFLKDVCIALLPITAFFIIMNAAMIRLPRKRLIKIFIGILYTFVGLSLFLAGANVGFISTGYDLGMRIAQLPNNKLLVPICAGIGCVLVLAEPAVQVLAKQVEDISNGNIKKTTIIITLCVSMAIAIGLSMLRVLTHLSIKYFIIPGYAVALILTFFTPKVYTAIAFDSGGVVSGPMTTAFMLPLAIGAATVCGGAESVLTDAYGVIALVALMPLITIQVFGIITLRKQKSRKVLIPKNVVLMFEGDVIELDYYSEN